MLGTDRIAYAEHVVIDAFWRVVTVPFPNAHKKEPVTADGQVALPRPGENETQPEQWTWGVDEAQEQASKDDACMYWADVVSVV